MMIAPNEAQTPPCIAIEGLSKVFRQRNQGQHLAGRIFRFFRPDAIAQKFEHLALRDIHLKVYPGDKVALLGHNGAGKTTLLRIMARILTPTEGEVKVQGRVAPLFQSGLGFHAELTGIENAELGCACFGMNRSQIQSSLPAILEFAELGEWLARPVKYYSSGMRARLSFAVSSHIEADVYLIDESLGAGDRAFRRKAQQRIDVLLERGKTWVIASHNLGELGPKCNRALLMEGGRLSEAPSVEAAMQWHPKRLPSARRQESPGSTRPATLVLSYPGIDLSGLCDWLERRLPERWAGKVVVGRVAPAICNGGLYVPVLMTHKQAVRDGLDHHRFLLVYRDLRDALVAICSKEDSAGTIPESRLMEALQGNFRLSARIHRSWWTTAVPRLSFEEILKSTSALVDALSPLVEQELGFPGAEIEALSLSNDVQPMVQPGDWRKHFTPSVAEEFAREHGDLLVLSGYEPDLSWLQRFRDQG